MSHTEQLTQIREFIAAHRQEMYDDLAAIVEVPSVVTAGLPGKPYGADCYEVLLRMEAIARKLGFATKISDDAVVTAEYGDRPAQLGLMAHLDVVAAGTGWTKPSYGLTVTEDRLYGRGVTDDKGPAIAILYAMKAARELCPDLPFSPQGWFGTAEEIGSPELKHYLTHTAMPRYNLTPDGIEPIVIGESAKHRPAFSMEWAKSDACPQVVHLQGGKVRNAVPGFADALVTGVTAAEIRDAAEAVTAKTEVRFLLTDTPEGLNIRAEGRGTHIGTPKLGRNGQTALVALLAELPLADCPSTTAIRKLAKRFPYGDLEGTGLGLTVRDDLMGPSSTNFTTCTLTETGVLCQLDSRGPSKATSENYAHVIDNALREAGFTVADSTMDDAHYVPESSPIVSLVKELYREVRGYEATCAFSIGASYAHYVDGAVSTGIAAPGIDTMLHKADEFLPLDDFDKLVELYTLAILRLCVSDPL